MASKGYTRNLAAPETAPGPKEPPRRAMVFTRLGELVCVDLYVCLGA